MLRAHPGKQKHPALTAQRLLLEQQVDGKNQCDKEIHKARDDTGGSGDRVAHQCQSAILQPVHHLLGHITQVQIPGLTQPVRQLRVTDHQLVGPLLRLCPEGGHPGCDGLHGVFQLGQNQKRHHHYYPDHRRQGKHQRNSPVSPLQLLGQMGLDGPHGHIQNEGHGSAQQERQQQAAHHAQKSCHPVHVLQAPVEQDAEGGNAQHIA